MKQERRSFSEEKEPKRLFSVAAGLALPTWEGGASRAALKKVFWFFSSEKNKPCFLTLLCCDD
jgi:hypothetical protein